MRGITKGWACNLASAHAAKLYDRPLCSSNNCG
jgi:hypothetical protein